MKRYLLGMMGVLFAAVALTAVLSPAAAATATGTAKVEWRSPPTVHFTLTPNYYTGYGAVKAVFGTQPAPTHGPGAPATVDFGTTIAGDTYLYKYAAELTVTTNDPSGFYIYGEAAAALTNSAGGPTYPINEALFYLPSGATSDSNTGFTPGLPFAQTLGAVSGGTDVSTDPATITYATYPNPIAVSSAENGNFYYDYQFKVPPAAAGGNYYVWIVYTVVGQ